MEIEQSRVQNKSKKSEQLLINRFLSDFSAVSLHHQFGENQIIDSAQLV
jgi:hypothetical protein